MRLGALARARPLLLAAGPARAAGRCSPRPAGARSTWPAARGASRACSPSAATRVARRRGLAGAGGGRPRGGPGDRGARRPTPRRSRWPDGAVDLVVCSMALLNFDDLDGAVREAARVLEPGGRLCFTTVHPWNSLKVGRRTTSPSAPTRETRTRDGLTMTFTDRHRPLSALSRRVRGRRAADRGAARAGPGRRARRAPARRSSSGAAAGLPAPAAPSGLEQPLELLERLRGLLLGLRRRPAPARPPCRGTRPAP